MQGVHPVLYAQALKHWRKAGRRSETCEIKLLIYTGDISEVPKNSKSALEHGDTVSADVPCTTTTGRMGVIIQLRTGYLSPLYKARCTEREMSSSEYDGSCVLMKCFQHVICGFQCEHGMYTAQASVLCLGFIRGYSPNRFLGTYPSLSFRRAHHQSVSTSSLRLRIVMASPSRNDSSSAF